MDSPHLYMSFCESSESWGIHTYKLSLLNEYSAG